jgi:hypothetical protein
MKFKTLGKLRRVLHLEGKPLQSSRSLGILAAMVEEVALRDGHGEERQAVVMDRRAPLSQG